jgi:hypothetical protein
MYKQVIDYLTNKPSTRLIESVETNARIPFDPANTDYAAYLKWLEEGNTPLPADEVTP